MTKKISVAILGAELTPLAKVGGLGDVMGALPKTLAEMGVDVSTFLPFYGLIDRSKLALELVAKDLDISAAIGKLSIWKTYIPGSKAALYLLEHPYFSGREIYSPEQLAGTELKVTEAQKFILFTQAALIAMKALGLRPEVIHLNDWHTAPLLAFLQEEKMQQGSIFSKTKTVYTIHNLANQGSFLLEGLSLPKNSLVEQSCLVPNIVNFMAMGIEGSDIVTTVSKTYAKEILGAEQGMGLNHILAKHQGSLVGVVNGIDVSLFDPKTDSSLFLNYDAGTIEKKLVNKSKLQEELGLPVVDSVPLFGLVSRLVNQKGLDLIDEKIGELDAQFVFLGTGQKEVEERVVAWSEKYPEKIKARIGFDAGLAQRIYAGADIFLMPSKFEPCGLGQLIAMRYGTLPLVRKTGGLADTVTNRKGFMFEQYEPKALYSCMKKAVKLYHAKPDAWKTRQISVMNEDYSWRKSAKKYVQIYKKIS